MMGFWRDLFKGTAEEPDIITLPPEPSPEDRQAEKAERIWRSLTTHPERWEYSIGSVSGREYLTARFGNVNVTIVMQAHFYEPSKQRSAYVMFDGPELEAGSNICLDAERSAWVEAEFKRRGVERVRASDRAILQSIY